MKTGRIAMLSGTCTAAIVASFVLLFTFSSVHLVSASPVTRIPVLVQPDEHPKLFAVQTISVTFPQGEEPPYAGAGIMVHPDPPVTGQPTELCGELINHDEHAHTVLLEFSVGDFGIGLPVTLVGSTLVEVPPQGSGFGCVVWLPQRDGPWTIDARILSNGVEIASGEHNLDCDEPLEPSVAHTRTIRVGNPFNEPVSVSLGVVPHLPDWSIGLYPDFLPEIAPGEFQEIVLSVAPPEDLPPDGAPIVDVEGYAGGELIGGFRKIFRPPVRLHHFADPPYAEREITVHPYPVSASEPTEICVELSNPTDSPHDVNVQFSWAGFGIGIPFTPINGLRSVNLPPESVVKECMHWVPPLDGHLCLQVEMQMEGYPPQFSQRNLDVDEPLVPNEPHSRPFPVGNPFDHPVTVFIEPIPHLAGWGVELSTDVLPDMQPGEVREVELTVIPSENLPPDGTPVVDVEARAGEELIGGFRKIYRPGVPIHRSEDPVYAESEIFVHPYPPREREPTEVGVEIRNLDTEPRAVELLFSAANFGIGMPFNPIHEPIELELPPRSLEHPAIMWLPPEGGLWCIQVEVWMDGHEEPFFSQRNIDVGEPLEPNVPHSRVFPVRNPFDHPVNIELGLIPHLPGWGIEPTSDIFVDMQPGEIREAELTVIPPDELPADGSPIVDVEGYADGQLIGGFRKIFRPPVPVHRPRDPIYAESEIGVDPYPVLPDQPVELSVEVFNPTDKDRIVTATFSVADFGIGLPFSPADIVPNPVMIFVPANGAARGHTIWQPQDKRGQFCVRVALELDGQEPVWSQRNIDIGEPLQPGVPHSLEFPVGSWPYTETVSVELGLVQHAEGWNVNLSQEALADVEPGEQVSVTLTVTPPPDAQLGTGEPIVDVEAFVDGVLIGGFRKLDRPLVPLHKPHEKPYAESEIRIKPYPPQKDVASIVSTDVQNTSDKPVTVEVAFGWAKFGVGIPFDTTGMQPASRSVTLNPGMTDTVSVTWTPTQSGHQCVLARLTDPGGLYPPQESQRNVDVEERPPCGETKTYSFTVLNNSPVSATVDIGMITFNVPTDWQVSTNPSGSVVMEPYGQLTVSVKVMIPCSVTAEAAQSQGLVRAMQAAAGSVPTVDVEGYVDGKLVGGIELRFKEKGDEQITIHLPFVSRR
jgi:hypothetical protein